jgi:hypothetical protein
MVQLYAYEGNTRYELDLYETEPIKLNFGIEDIIDITRIESTYSQTFRIPATQRNSRFFKWWYEMNTVDFDITKVVRGEIHSDGIIFQSGELRLQAAYINKESDNVDLEIVFLGNTRDFATQIAEIYMNQLDLSEYNHELTWKDDGSTDGTLEDSWKPLGSGALMDGAVRYVIADRGLTFTDGHIAGSLAEIVAEHNHTKSFQKQQHPMLPTQFTPMVQVQKIVKAIFDRTEYDWTDDSFFSDTSTYWPMVQNLYTDGLPGETPEIVYLSGNIDVNNPGNNIAMGTESRFNFPNEVVDPSNAWKQSSDSYVAQADETALGIKTQINFAWSGEAPGLPGSLYVKLWKTVNGIPQVIDNVTVNANQVNMQYTYIYNYVLDPINNPTISIDAGEELYITYEIDGITERAAAFGFFTTEGGIDTVNVAQLLKDDVLIIDFLKDIFTKFRLVMAPVPEEPYKFKILPWTDYIGSGDILDWTYKLDNSKDVVVKPIFFEQSQDILFTDAEDTDQVNDFYQNQNNLIFGEYLYDGANELITGRREVTTGFAPTPIQRVEEFPGSSNFIIPKFYVQGSENNLDASHDHLQHLPMRPKPRLLFWNGMITINGGETWYYGTTNQNAIEMSDYPRVSYSTEIPNSITSLNLNWSNINTYLENINTPDGESVYERYWFDYIQSLYSKDARQYTAYFLLDSQDLRQFGFNDIIFIEGNYYRIAKIYDAPLDGISPIKIDLIKLVNYKR